MGPGCQRTRAPETGFPLLAVVDTAAGSQFDALLRGFRRRVSRAGAWRPRKAHPGHQPRWFLRSGMEEKWVGGRATSESLIRTGTSSRLHTVRE